MKTAWLLLYLWHQTGIGQDASGGPSLVVAAMPSLQICEIVGTEAKAFADTQSSPRHSYDPKSAAYRCVQVDAAAPSPIETEKRLRREIADREAELARLRGGR